MLNSNGSEAQLAQLDQLTQVAFNSNTSRRFKHIVPIQTRRANSNTSRQFTQVKQVSRSTHTARSIDTGRTQFTWGTLASLGYAQFTQLDQGSDSGVKSGELLS